MLENTVVKNNLNLVEDKYSKLTQLEWRINKKSD